MFSDGTRTIENVTTCPCPSARPRPRSRTPRAGTSRAAARRRGRPRGSAGRGSCPRRSRAGSATPPAPAGKCTRARRREQHLDRARRLRRLLLAHRYASGSKQAMSVISPTVCSRQRARTRMPVRMRAVAAGVDGVQQRRRGAVELDQRARERVLRAAASRAAARTHAQLVTTPARPTSTNSRERLARLGVVLLRRHQHAAVLRAHAEDLPLAQRR